MRGNVKQSSECLCVGEIDIVTEIAQVKERVAKAAASEVCLPSALLELQLRC